MMDFRSDTVTKPTEEMRKAMFEAEVGDDVYGDDPTVNELEKLAADLLGKDAALFVPSGTFSNQLAIMTHTRRGDEVIVLEDSHILLHEAGAAGLLSGVNLRAARSYIGDYDLNELKRLYREDDIHHPVTSLICLENAHGNGKVIDLLHMKEVYEFANSRDVSVHLDGARIFNAATFLGEDVKEIAKYADSVSMCLSKGLCSPVGSILLGDKDFIKKARRNRKKMGGALRQAGVLAACGIVSLEKMTKRLYEDHDNANYFALLADEIEEIEIEWDRCDINMIFFKSSLDLELEEELAKRDILINPQEFGEYRIVMHNGITRENVDCLIIAIKEIIGEYRGN